MCFPGCVFFYVSKRTKYYEGRIKGPLCPWDILEITSQKTPPQLKKGRI